MCLALLKPAGKQVPDEYLARAAARHPHGFGLGWTYPGSGQLHLWRSVTDTKAWRRKVASLTDAVVVAHARYATHGPKVKANCHPAWLGAPGRSLVAHNGVLRSLPDCKAGRSDSRVFIDHVLAHFATGWQQDRVLVSQLESLIGTGNKLIVLNADASWLILNERIGHWANGVWYSNDSYKPVEKYDMGWGDDVDEAMTYYYARRYGGKPSDYTPSSRSSGSSTPKVYTRNPVTGEWDQAVTDSCDAGCAVPAATAASASTEPAPALAFDDLWWLLESATTDEYYGTVCGSCIDAAMELLSATSDNCVATVCDFDQDEPEDVRDALRLVCDHCGLTGAQVLYGVLDPTSADAVEPPHAAAQAAPTQLALPLPVAQEV